MSKNFCFPQAAWCLREKSFGGTFGLVGKAKGEPTSCRKRVEGTSATCASGAPDWTGRGAQLYLASRPQDTGTCVSVERSLAGRGLIVPF